MCILLSCRLHGCLHWQGGVGDIGKLIGPFSSVIDGIITDEFVRNWLDLLSFLLSGERRDGLPTSLCIPFSGSRACNFCWFI